MFEEIINFLVPSSKVTKPIECFVELANQVFITKLLKSFLLLHVNHFIKITIQESCFDVHL